MPKAPHFALGAAGEDAAAGFLEASGYAILGRNWRHGQLELDAICEMGGEIIFVEVKTRHSRLHGGGPAAITPHKQRSLIKGAQLWLLSHNLWERPCRFDVICAYREGGQFCLEHYPDAFRPAMDSRHSHWLPW